MYSNVVVYTPKLVFPGVCTVSLLSISAHLPAWTWYTNARHVNRRKAEFLQKILRRKTLHFLTNIIKY